MMRARLIALLALLAPAAQAADRQPTALACDLPAAPAVGASGAGAASQGPERIFLVGPASIQEWSPTEQAFGANLCESYSCLKNAERVEGTISSASVAYTIGLDQGGAHGYWRVIGASGFAAKEGACRIIPRPMPRH